MTKLFLFNNETFGDSLWWLFQNFLVKMFKEKQRKGYWRVREEKRREGGKWKWKCQGIWKALSRPVSVHAQRHRTTQPSMFGDAPSMLGTPLFHCELTLHSALKFGETDHRQQGLVIPWLALLFAQFDSTSRVTTRPKMWSNWSLPMWLDDTPSSPSWFPLSTCHSYFCCQPCIIQHRLFKLKTYKILTLGFLLGSILVIIVARRHSSSL